MLKNIYWLIKESVEGWSRNEATLYAAALAFYTIFSLAPLLIISVSIASLLFSQAIVEGLLIEIVEDLLGSEAATYIQDIIINSTDIISSSIAIGIGLIIFLYTASIIFFKLQVALNAMWGIALITDDVRKSALATIRTWLLSAAAVLAAGLVLMIALILNTIWVALPQIFIAKWLPGAENIIAALGIFIAPLVYAIIFAAIFKFLPRATVCWRDVWPGAIITAIAFWIGSSIIGFTMSRSWLSTVYGAASSLIIILVWIYYSTWIVLFGAKFIQVYARKFGTPIVPDATATYKPN